MHNSNNVILCMSLYFGNIKSKCLEVINSPCEKLSKCLGIECISYKLPSLNRLLRQ